MKNRINTLFLISVQLLSLLTGCGSVVVSTRKGTKLGIFGINVLGEPEILWEGTPTIETCQRLTDELRDEGCSTVVGITHIGFPLDDDTLMETFGANDSNSAQVALHTTGIDAIVDAHSHTIINNGYGVTYGGTYINQAYAYGQAIGLIKFAGIREYKYFRQISGMRVEYSAGETNNTIYRLTVGDTVVYENGSFCVGDDWSVDCVYGLTDQTNIENTDHGKMLIPNNKELIERFCEYLEKEDETIYPDIVAPDGRIKPH